MGDADGKEGVLRHFFLPKELLRGKEVVILGALAHRMQNVLRLQVGDEVMLLDGEGWQYRAELARMEKGKVLARISRKSSADDAEPRLAVILYQALIRPQRFEQVLEKGTELGVARFIPLLSERSVAKGIGSQRRARMERIIREAAEQCGRGRLPQLEEARDLDSACRQARDKGGMALLPWEEGGQPLREALGRETSELRQVSIFIGPEGGFSALEVERAIALGVVPVTLGPRTLRSETAALVAVALVLYELDELGPTHCD